MYMYNVERLIRRLLVLFSTIVNVLIEGGGSFYELELMKFLYNTRKSLNLQTLL